MATESMFHFRPRGSIPKSDYQFSPHMLGQKDNAPFHFARLAGKHEEQQQSD